MSNFSLDELRMNIDEIDLKLVELLEKRMQVSEKVGEYKEKNKLEVLNIQRELEVITKVSELVTNKKYVSQTSDIYFEIMKTSRTLQLNNSYPTSYGLLGESLKHSISPEIHNSLFNHYNLKENYALFEIKPDYLSRFMVASEKYDLKGLNVTIPYKIDVMQYLDKVDDDAKAIGSINTIKIANGKKTGFNTDYYGFAKLLEVNKISVDNKTVAILGSGGSCKTVKYYCEQNSAKKIYIVSRNKQGEGFINYNDLKTIEFDILVNTTPVGMYPNIDDMPVEDGVLKQKHQVIDLIYNPKTTRLLETANKVGCTSAINGELMLYYQALKAQEIWGLCKCSEENVKIINAVFEK